MDPEAQQDLTAFTVELLSAFVSNNNVRSEDLPGLITATHQALSGLQAKDAGAEAPAVEEHVAAVSARKSLANRDVILSLIDGKPYKSLKRHLTTRGLSPDEYRARYDLPASYPMIAPGYSQERRAAAKRLGLGRKRSAPTAEAVPATASPPAAASPPAPAKRKYTRREKKPETAS